MYGWTGTLLHVDLTGSRITRSATEPYAEKYLGGRGIASRIYGETVPPEISAFDPENRLIFMTGPLVATGAQAATRMSVVGKSPMTLPEGYCYGNIGGFFAAELKKAGYDGIIVSGRAPEPVYLWINDGEVELRDATSLWGQGNYRTGELLRQSHGDKMRYLATGPAGENLVRTAVISASHEGACSAGFGAVMGSKNLKAIAVRGTGRPAVADPDKLKELNRYTVTISKRYRLSMPPTVAATGHDHLLEVIGKGGCYQCGLECIRGLYRYGGQPELEGYRKCAAMEYYLPWRYAREDEPVKTFFDAPTLANDYSLETWELKSMIDWLYDCFQAGALTEAETGLPLSRIGTREFLEKLLHAIAYREGFGDILAEGMARAALKLPEKARALISPSVAPIGINDLFPARVFTVNALLYPMEPRVHHNILHEPAWVSLAWNFNQLEPGTTPVTLEVVRKIARAFWGSEAAADVTGYEGKALAVQRIQNRTYLKESLGLCDFTYPITYSFNTPDNVGDPDIEAKLFHAVTGVDGAELDRYAERIANIQRVILLREGRQTPQADYPPEFNFTERLEDVPNFEMEAVPGPGGEPVPIRGRILDREGFGAMLREYYCLRSWDENTGIPLPATLKELGIEDLAFTPRGHPQGGRNAV